jgi:unsaturated chondroitin disaccharide hydrolase
MIRPTKTLKPADLTRKLSRLWELSANKIAAIEETWQPGSGAPVFTVNGRYTSKGWTEWTQGFQFGSAILQFDVTCDGSFLELSRKQILRHMASHVTHFGVHDHGFNNVSTYGNLLRLMNEGRIEENAWERNFYELALKASGAVQAHRWTPISDGGFIYSFNGPHSLFADTIRSLRALALSHRLGHVLMDERDRQVSLLHRLIQHTKATAEYSVYYGEGRDTYDIRGRVAHESVFNTNDGSYRCPNSQQGYSPFTTWTRGLAWIMLGFAEQLEFLETISDEELEEIGERETITNTMLNAARATCDFYIANTPTDGIPYWDTGAPSLAKMDSYLERPADPFNDFEPVDSSAAPIAAQALLRLGHYLERQGKASNYTQAGLTIADTLFDEPYLSTAKEHQGLILHSVYHRPNGWDTIPPGSHIPCGESSMWGDYHARELALYIQRLAQSQPYYTFFGPTT